jgi:vanillate/3-O-methylgallate O-demethylase
MERSSLQQKMDESGNLLEVLRNLQTGANIFPVVPSEYSNWRDEQLAWGSGVALLDLTHHMPYMYIKGTDILKLVTLVGANSFKGFQKGKAKQLVCCTPEGLYLGDGILFFLEEDEILFVGRPTVGNWLQYQAERERLDVAITREARSPSRPMGAAVHRSLYRYQIQGPLAVDVIKKLNGGEVPDIKFFSMGHITIGRHRVRALRHGMAGTLGLEIWGPYEHAREVMDYVLAAGAEFGIRPVGSRAYPTTPLGSGWIPSPLPAIYTGESLRGYREWLSADSYEANTSIGGSFEGDSFESYYVSPYELGYGQFIKFDHDFIGREALEAVDPASLRRKVTFVWNSADVAEVQASLMDPSQLPYKYIEMPLSIYSAPSYDRIALDGAPAGISMYAGFDYNFRRMLSIGIVAPEVATGDEVILTWGERNGGSAKATVERHRQTDIRAVVELAPYSQVAREDYRIRELA